MRLQASSMVRSAARRGSALSLAKSCSMGLRSGEYGGRNSSLAPAVRMARRWPRRAGGLTLSRPSRATFPLAQGRRRDTGGGSCANGRDGGARMISPGSILPVPVLARPDAGFRIVTAAQRIDGDDERPLLYVSSQLIGRRSAPQSTSSADVRGPRTPSPVGHG